MKHTTQATDTANRQKYMQRSIQLAEAITHGDWLHADLACPACGSRMIVFSFTVIDPPRHGLFIRCMDCKDWQHFSLGDKPPNFREDLVLPEYQKLEDEAHQNAVVHTQRLKVNQHFVFVNFVVAVSLLLALSVAKGVFYFFTLHISFQQVLALLASELVFIGICASVIFALAFRGVSIKDLLKKR